MLHKVKNHEWITLLFLLLTIFHQIEANYISLTVQTSSTQINLPSTYTFTFNRQYDPVNFAFIPNPTAVPIGTSIIITLPSQFITISSGSTLSCINTANSQSLTCNVNTAAKTITITDYYSTSSTLTTNQIIINVYNLINAYKAGPSDNFYWQIVSPNNTVIDQGPAINSNVYSTSITFTAGQFICNNVIIKLVVLVLAEPMLVAILLFSLIFIQQILFQLLDS